MKYIDPSGHYVLFIYEDPEQYQKLLEAWEQFKEGNEWDKELAEAMEESDESFIFKGISEDGNINLIDDEDILKPDFRTGTYIEVDFTPYDDGYEISGADKIRRAWCDVEWEIAGWYGTFMWRAYGTIEILMGGFMIYVSAVDFLQPGGWIAAPPLIGLGYSGLGFIFKGIEDATGMDMPDMPLLFFE